VPPQAGAAHETSDCLRALEYTGSRVTWFLEAQGLEVAADVSAQETALLGPVLEQDYQIWLNSSELHFLS
jgi:hypothetical protein